MKFSNCNTYYIVPIAFIFLKPSFLQRKKKKKEEKEKENDNIDLIDRAFSDNRVRGSE